MDRKEGESWVPLSNKKKHHLSVGPAEEQLTPTAVVSTSHLAPWLLLSLSGETRALGIIFTLCNG